MITKKKGATAKLAIDYAKIKSGNASSYALVFQGIATTHETTCSHAFFRSYMHAIGSCKQFWLVEARKDSVSGKI